MSQDNSFAAKPGMWLRNRFLMPKWWLVAGAVLIAFAVVGSMPHAVATSETATHGRFMWGWRAAMQPRVK